MVTYCTLKINILRSELLVVANILVTVSWVVMACCLVNVTNTFKKRGASIFIVEPRSSKTLVTTHNTTPCDNPEDHNQQL
jgi:hypothetical protein